MITEVVFIQLNNYIHNSPALEMALVQITEIIPPAYNVFYHLHAIFSWEDRNSEFHKDLFYAVRVARQGSQFIKIRSSLHILYKDAIAIKLYV